MINLKRLTIEELNQLAGQIIDELNSREEEPSNKFDNAIEKVIAKSDEYDQVAKQLDELYEKQYLIEDEVERLEDLLRTLDEKFDEAYEEYKYETR
jgi:tetrahydromethanopterin S-methyltransferase subunit G